MTHQTMYHTYEPNLELLQQSLVDLRQPETRLQPTTIITLRMSEEQHLALKHFAWKAGLSLNRFCVEILISNLVEKLK